MVDKLNKIQTPEENLINNISQGVNEILIDSFIQYGVEKIRQKIPEWKEKIQKWKM